MSTQSAVVPLAEPWLRGTHVDVPAVARGLLHALDLASEDLGKWTAGLTGTEVHDHPLGLPSISFHLKHIARSVDRLLSYAEGKQLSIDQIHVLKSEQDGAEQLAILLAEVDVSFKQAAERVRALSVSDLEAFRGVGKKQLPTRVGGLLVHVADHTQRHVGQVVTTAKVLVGLRG